MIDPQTRDALLHISELLLMGYHLNREEERFILVCECRCRAPSAARAFGELRFEHVRDFRREAGLFKPSQAVTEVFVARDHVQHWEVESVAVGHGDPFSSIEFSLGISYGRVGFSCTTATHRTVQLRATTKPDGWDYFEVTSGRAVDFWNPFDHEWAKTSKAKDRQDY